MLRKSSNTQNYEASASGTETELASTLAPNGGHSNTMLRLLAHRN